MCSHEISQLLFCFQSWPTTRKMSTGQYISTMHTGKIWSLSRELCLILLSVFLKSNINNPTHPFVVYSNKNGQISYYVDVYFKYLFRYMSFEKLLLSSIICKCALLTWCIIHIMVFSNIGIKIQLKLFSYHYFILSYNVFMFAVFRKAASTISKYPNKIKSGEEAKKLVCILNAVEIMSLSYG